MATTEDSATKRYLWNYYNRIERAMVRKETTSSWTYTTASFRQANNSASNQIDYVCGVAEDAVYAEVTSSCSNASATSVMVGIGVDSTSVDSGNSNGSTAVNSSHATSTRSCYVGVPGVGRHYLAWLEYSEASGTTTWYGNGTLVVSFKNGIFGRVMG